MVFQLKVQDMLQKYWELYLSTIRYHWVLRSLTSSVGGGIFFLLLDESHFYFPQNFSRIILIIEISNEILALFVRNFSIDLLMEHIVDFISIFVRHFGFDMHFEEITDSRFELGLDEPKFLINFISEYLAKHSYVIVLGWVLLYAGYDIVGGLKGQTLRGKGCTLRPYFWLR